MNAYIKFIGILDRQLRHHAVTFTRGVNVITGRSSTGKSALIEIFDYCFGCEEYTVPVGVITKHATLYFTVLRLESRDLVLARRPNEKSAFIRVYEEGEGFKSPEEIKADYFDEAYFLRLADFKESLAAYFDLTVTNVEVVAQSWSGRKKPGPSVRSFASFMLQHQNLVANKHAIFYRFDEKEKQEQAIDHFDIFVGFADQTYFLKKQELDELDTRRKRLEIEIPRVEQLFAATEAELEILLNHFVAITGKKLDILSAKQAVKSPKKALDVVQAHKLQVVPLSDEHAIQRQALEDKKAELTSSLRKAHNELRRIRTSINAAQSYKEGPSNAPIPESADLMVSRCPFCDSMNRQVESEGNKLFEAITWLNSELTHVEYHIESFEKAAQDTERDILAIGEAIQNIDVQIESLDQVIKELEKHRAQYELAMKAKVQIETLLEAIIAKKRKSLDAELETVKKKITELREFLSTNYNLKDQREKCEAEINRVMNEIGSKLDFEASYKPINLQFSLDSFDLWHNSPDGKVFLRAMGSGANWLYSHVSLFLSLHRYFCARGPKCTIPPILFLDQPSQVYFPTVLDSSDKFNPAEIAQKTERRVDEDLKAVTNLFDQLVSFCTETEKLTGLNPQIIVTDHADQLQLTCGVSFESLVNGRRWRTRGFIDEARIAEGTPATHPEKA